MDVDRIISADDHMDLNVLPPTLFSEGLPPSLRDRGPRVEDGPDGPQWVAEGRVLGLSGRRASGLLQHEQHGYRPGDPTTRLEDMDRDGVYAQVVYGPPTGIPVDNVALRHACMAVYNDWAAAFNAVDPNRLVVLAMLPGTDPATATGELRRVAGLGHKGVLLHAWEAAEPVFEDGWAPFWAAADELGLPVHFHLGGGLHSLQARPGSWRMPAMVSVIPMQLDELLVGVIFSGILERHPNVSLVLGESGLGWIPYVLERMDHEHHKYAASITDVRLPELPSTYFARQVFATYEEDELGLELIARIGADNVMWASDYPHGDSTWPNSHQAIEESWLGKLDPPARAKILHDTAARVYQLA
jgi:uncharacterized protein